MNPHPSIISYILLRNNQISVDGKIVFENKTLKAVDFLHAAYEHFQINYPKFFKMDNLCKTGFLAAEILLHEKNLFEKFQNEEKGIVLSTSNGCLDTDIRYEASTHNAASPSLFVYTLPNILIGEISIRHQFKGESACFVFDIFNPVFQAQYVNQLLQEEKIKICVSGWADFFNEKAEAFFYLAEKTNQTSLQHTSDNLQNIFQTT